MLCPYASHNVIAFTINRIKQTEILNFARHQDMHGHSGSCTVGTECLCLIQNRYSNNRRVLMQQWTGPFYVFSPQKLIAERTERARVTRSGALWTVRFSWMGCLTLILLTWKIKWANTSKWQVGFNLAFKGLTSREKCSRQRCKNFVKLIVRTDGVCSCVVWQMGRDIRRHI